MKLHDLRILSQAGKNFLFLDVDQDSNSLMISYDYTFLQQSLLVLFLDKTSCQRVVLG